MCAHTYKKKHTQKAKWSFYSVAKVFCLPPPNITRSVQRGLIRFDRPFSNHISPKPCKKAKEKEKKLCVGKTNKQKKELQNVLFCFFVHVLQHRWWAGDPEPRNYSQSLQVKVWSSHSGLGSSNKCPKKCVWPLCDFFLTSVILLAFWPHFPSFTTTAISSKCPFR